MPRLQVATPVTLNPAPQRVANTANGEAPRADHQRWDELAARFGAPVTYQNLASQTSGHILHPDLPAQTLFSYNGIVPGPLFHAFYNQRVIFFSTSSTTITKTPGLPPSVSQAASSMCP
jgi:hypothetical protein